MEEKKMILEAKTAAFLNDIPIGAARAAHQFTSFSPEDRGDQERREYAATLAQDLEALGRYATTDAKRAQLEVEFARYREGYKARYLARLAAHSRCASTMITGGSGFNVRRADKANDVEHKRTQELIAFRERALTAIRKVLTPELAPIMKGDADAGERLADKIAKLEAFQAQMKAANAAIRKHAKAGPDAQVAALGALGLSEKIARKLLEPDFAGRIGFPDYEIKNNNANIRRLKGRAEQVERAQAQPVEQFDGADAKFEDDPPENRVRLFFSGKPALEVRDELKRNAFRWTPSLGCWQAYRNVNTIAVAKRLAGAPERDESAPTESDTPCG